jgi:hypothetical protein
VRPREAWLLNRASGQPRQPGDETPRAWRQRVDNMLAATSIDDLFARMEADDLLWRIDRTRSQTMYRCANVGAAELEQLRRVEDVVRLGHVRAITSRAMLLDGGEVPTDASALHVDCSADGLLGRPAVPVFHGNAMTLQAVRSCQQVFSAAFIAHVEHAFGSDAEKNAFRTPIPHPDSHLDYLRSALASSLNERRWAQQADLRGWLRRARLYTGFRVPPPESAPEAAVTLAAGAATQGALRNRRQRMLDRLAHFVAEADALDAARAGGGRRRLVPAPPARPADPARAVRSACRGSGADRR